MTSSLQQGIDAAKSGMMEQALAHLKDAIVEEPENANVWVWLSAIIEDEEKQVIFLKKALEIDPNNRPAQRGLAFIERKKYIPPKPGEKLSDYTKPIGVFKTPSQAAANVAAAAKADRPAPQPQPVAVYPTPVAAAQPIQASAARHPWLDILLYGLTLTVFIIIGILIGTTLLNVDIPFLVRPTPVLSTLPPSEGVYALNGDLYAEMDLFYALPEGESGIPQLTNRQPSIVINDLFITLDRLQLLDEKGEAVPFTATPAENNMHLIVPSQELTPGRYCLVLKFNPDKTEALYWCLKVNE
jgi:tetratricopeptide (TPR) repeat protein